MKFKSLLLFCLAIIVFGLAVIFVTQNNKNYEGESQEKIPTKIELPKTPVTKKLQDNKVEVEELLRPDPMPFNSVTDMVRFGLAEALGRDAKFSETYRRESDQWILLCGRPVEQDGSPFDYFRSTLKSSAQENLMEDKACLLGTKFETTVLLRETDIGSLDSPILSWVEKYELPLELIQ